jgi:integrase
MAQGRPFGTIRKLPSGRYQGRYSHLGRQVSSGSTFRSKSAARARLSSVETDINRGSHIDPDAGSIQFGVFASEWIDQRGLRHRTRDTYQSQLRHINDTFATTQIRTITPPAVRAWHGRLLNTGLSQNTVAKIYRLFRTILATAVDDGLLKGNPVSIKGAAVERSHERPALTWDEVQQLAEAIEPRFKALVWTAATSALRFGELTGLTRAHLDLDRSELRVEQSLSFVKGAGPVLGPPKSDAAHRTVVVPSSTTELLARHVEHFTAASAGALVFTSVKGSPLLNRYFAPYWQRAKSTSGVAENVRFHDLRHLAGTAAATAGASVKEIMARMGHSSSDASLRYLAAAETRDREIAESIQTRIDSTLPK